MTDATCKTVREQNKETTTAILSQQGVANINNRYSKVPKKKKKYMTKEMK